MSEINEGYISNEVIKEKEIVWRKLDQPNINAINSQLKNNGLSCLEDAMCFKNFDSDTIGVLNEMLADITAGDEVRKGIKYPLNVAFQALNPTDGSSYIIHACKPTDTNEFFQKLNNNIDRANHILEKVKSDIRLPKHL